MQTEPEEPSPREQEDEESSREEKSTEEHWARGMQEEDEKLPWKPFCCSPNLPTLLAENEPLELLKPRPWDELESDTVKEEEPRPWEELEEEPEAWMEAEAEERPKLI